MVWVDAGNMFDTYQISSYAANHQIDPVTVHRGIRLSRAFTYHQVSAMLRRLPSEVDRLRASVAVISDMTALYCDPDVRDKEDALETFKRDVRFLREMVVLVVVTVLRQRNRMMDGLLSEVEDSQTIRLELGRATSDH